MYPYNEKAFYQHVVATYLFNKNHILDIQYLIKSHKSQNQFDISIALLIRGMMPHVTTSL